MSVPTDLKKFERKAYRDGFLHSQVRGAIAYQIQALRAKFGLTQADFAEKTGKKQSTVSRLENTEYGRVSVQTLLDIASALDVALLVRFVSYPEFILRTANVSEAALQPDTIFQSLEARSPPQPASSPQLLRQWPETQRQSDSEETAKRALLGVDQSDKARGLWAIASKPDDPSPTMRQGMN